MSAYLPGTEGVTLAQVPVALGSLGFLAAVLAFGFVACLAGRAWLWGGEPIASSAQLPCRCLHQLTRPHADNT